MTDNIIYVPIQINGGGNSEPSSLLDRELFVLDNGTLYVGHKKADGSIEVMNVVGKVVPNAELDSPIIKNKLFVDDSLVVDTVTDVTSPEKGQVVFVKEK